MNNLFRNLRADEIDCRISQIKVEEGQVKWISLLLYKDARCDQNILDETFGAFGWQKKYTRDNRNCIVSVWDKDKNQWIEKEDTGTESNTEREKGLASDSFKRSCFCWGIGRALYTAPFIMITPDKFNVKQIGGKFYCYDNFVVTDIDYNGGNICYLTIKNNKTGKECFRWGKKGAQTTEKDIAPDNEPDSNGTGSAGTQRPNVTTAPKLPEDAANVPPPAPKVPENPVFRFLNNEKAFMSQRLEISDKEEMRKKFASMRNALIKGKVIDDIPPEKLTMEQAQQMINAMYDNFFSDKKESA